MVQANPLAVQHCWLLTKVAQVSTLKIDWKFDLGPSLFFYFWFQLLIYRGNMFKATADYEKNWKKKETNKKLS